MTSTGSPSNGAAAPQGKASEQFDKNGTRVDRRQPPEMPESELPEVSRSPSVKAKPAKSGRLFTYGELERLPDPEWLIDGVLPEGLSVLCGKPKKGKKTFTALDMALTIESGAEWFGRKVKRGLVVYVAGEGFTGIKKRIRTWVREKGAGRKPRSFLAHRGAVNMTLPAATKAFIAEVKEHGKAKGERVALIVLDTLSRCFGGQQENDSEAMGRFVHHCDLLISAFPDCSVLVLHHPGKNDKKGLRGHTTLLGALECAMWIGPPNENDKVNLRLACTEMKEAEEFKPIALRFDPRGESGVVVEGSVSGLAVEKAAPPHRKPKKVGEAEVLALLGDGPKAFTVLLNAIREKRPTFSKETLNTRLKELSKKRLIKRVQTDEGDPVWQLRSASGSH